MSPTDVMDHCHKYIGLSMINVNSMCRFHISEGRGGIVEAGFAQDQLQDWANSLWRLEAGVSQPKPFVTQWNSP